MRTTAAFAGTLAALLPLQLLLLLLFASAPPARAQGGHGRMLRTLVERPLHIRVALADAAVVATVGEVGLGRIRVRDAEPIFGDARGVPREFELKRAPSHPPKLSSGDRCVLLLRGARSPYLLVDDPGEIPRPAGEAEEREWRGAVRAVREADGDPGALLGAYTARLDAESLGVRRAAIAGMADPEAPFQPLDDTTSARLAAAAGDPSLDRLARLAAAIAATRTEGGQAALLAWLPGEGESADPQVLLAVMRAAVVRKSPDLGTLLMRSLRHPSPEIRRAAVGFRGATSDPEVRGEIERLAAEDPDEEVRVAARRALGGSAGR